MAALGDGKGMKEACLGHRTVVWDLVDEQAGLLLPSNTITWCPQVAVLGHSGLINRCDSTSIWRHWTWLAYKQVCPCYHRAAGDTAKKNANKHTFNDIATMGPNMFENRWALEHGRCVNRCVKAII